MLMCVDVCCCVLMFVDVHECALMCVGVCLNLFITDHHPSAETAVGWCEDIRV
jgi:hypothetical protein